MDLTTAAAATLSGPRADLHRSSLTIVFDHCVSFRRRRHSSATTIGHPYDVKGPVLQDSGKATLAITDAEFSASIVPAYLNSGMRTMLIVVIVAFVFI